MNRGFLSSSAKTVSKTRSGKAFARPSPPAIDDSNFPALPTRSPGNFLQLPSQASAGAKSSFQDLDNQFSPYKKTPPIADLDSTPADVVSVEVSMQLEGPGLADNVSIGAAGPATSSANATVQSEVPANVSSHSARAWSSLFKRIPSNAGRYISKNFTTSCVNGVLVPPVEVINAGLSFWKDYLVGFFLDRNLPFNMVKNHLLRVWKLSGTVEIFYDKDLFFFKFSCPDDRSKILESDPFIIMNKAFIVTDWNPTIDKVREQVRSIRVWVKLSNIPTLYQPMEGLDWLVSQIGKLVCFDVTTERRDRLEYAIALVEITPDKLLPSSLSVFLTEHTSGQVDVSYKWKPSICSVCRSFGHIAASCPRDPSNGKTFDISTLPPRVPLQKPAPREWRAKPAVTPLDIGSSLLDSINSDGPADNSLADNVSTVNDTAPLSSIVTALDLMTSTSSLVVAHDSVTTSFAPASSGEASSFVGLMSYLASAPPYRVDIPTDSMIPPPPTVVVDLDTDDHEAIYSIDEIIPAHLRD